MYEAVLILGLLYIAFAIIRSYVIYYKCQPHTRKERRSAPYYYNSPKQGTIRAQDCAKMVTKPPKKP